MTEPLNEYQVNNRKGSERIVNGFYIDSDGNFLIDRLTTEGTELGKCNACKDAILEGAFFCNTQTPGGIDNSSCQ